MRPTAETSSPGIKAASPRRLGIYYTPDDVAEVLVRWALPCGVGRVLDPSFGGCSFLRAALAISQAATTPGVSLFGVDIDVGAAVYAKELHRRGVPKNNLVRGDFFSVEPSRFGSPAFDAIVGNPPYIRHHWHHGRSRELAEQIASDAGVALPGRADAWAYFVVHSLRFLRSGGRLAFLLPIAVLHADYAQAVLEHLTGRFEELRLIELSKRLFVDAAEATVILAAKGHCSSGPATLTLSTASGPDELETVLGSASAGQRVHCADRRTWALGGLPENLQSAWHSSSQRKEVRSLGDLARIRIGVVTGANQFFVRTKRDFETLRQPGITSRLIVSRAADLQTPRFTEADLRRIQEKDRPAHLLLLRHDGPQPNGRLALLIRQAEEGKLHLRSQHADSQ